MCYRVSAIVALASACGASTPATGPDYVVTPGTIAGESAIAVAEPLLKISLMIRDIDGLHLFEDEQLEAANIIATWAKTTNLTIEAASRTREKVVPSSQMNSVPGWLECC